MNPISMCISLLGLLQEITIEFGSLKQQQFIFPQCKQVAPNQEVRRAMLTFKFLEKGASLPFPSFWWLLHKSWCSVACKHITLIFASIITWHSSLVSVSRFPSSFKDMNHWIKTHPNSVRPHFNYITSANTLFPNKITFTVWWTWFWGKCYLT